MNINNHIVELSTIPVENSKYVDNTWKELLYDNPISEIKISLPNLDDYFDSEEFIFDILCRGFQLSIKNITSRAVAIKMKIDSIKVALSVNLPVQERYKNLLSMIPLLIIQGYYLEAQDKLESAGLIFNSDELSLWKGWILLLNSKNPQNFFNFQHLKGNLKILGILGHILTVYKFSWFGYRRAKTEIKKLEFGDWNEILDVWIDYNYGDLESETTAVEKLHTIVHLNSYIGLLSFLIMFKHYKNYDKLGNIISLCSRLNSLQLFSEFKLIILASYIKIAGKMRNLNELKGIPRDILIFYQYARCAIKYSLEIPTNFVRTCLDTVISYLERFKISNSLFCVLFWKFQLYRTKGIHMTAMSIAKLALKYETKDKEKEKAVLKYLEKIKSVTDYLDFLYKGCKEKVLTKKIEEFDEYIGKSLIILLEKPSDLSLHYYLLGFPYRFEGYFINWIRNYKLNKFRENRLKSESSQEINDENDIFHPLHYTSQIKNNYPFIKATHSSCLSIKLSCLWNLCGKNYGPIGISDSIDIMEAKSYLRTNIHKSIKILKKGLERPNPSPMLHYFLGKFQLEILKLKRDKKPTKLKTISNCLSSFSPLPSTSDIYKIKVLYYNSELQFLFGNLEEANKYYSAAEHESIRYNCQAFLLRSSHIVSWNVL